MSLPNSIAELLDCIPDSRSRYALRRIMDALFPSVDTGLVATGTNATTALLMLAQTNIFGTVVAGTGAILNPAFLGTCRVINSGVNDLLIYPPSTAQIGSGAAGVGVIVSPGVAANFSTNSPATLWTAS
jgi:hypothetical protein